MSWTKAQIVAKVELDLDLQEETIITPTELTGYINEAIRDARAIIENLEEDYFLESAPLTLVLGADLISLPADIYATKIREIVYDEGNNGKLYDLKRIRNLRKFLSLADLARDSSAETEYRYFLMHASAAAGVKIKITPPAKVSSSSLLTVWYRRNANVLSVDADVCDIPEFIDYIFAHTKRSCLTKMNNGIVPAEAEAVVMKEEKRMAETLTNMVPDNNDNIEPDFSHYEEST